MKDTDQDLKMDSNHLTIAARKAAEAEKERLEVEARIKANKAKTLAEETAKLNFIKAEFEAFKADNTLIDTPLICPTKDS